MALQFIFGGAGSGKTRCAMKRVIAEAEVHPERKYLYLVPEQATMEAQRELVRLHPRHALLNIEVLSLTRLAWRVFDETGFRNTELLGEIGKTFLLEKVTLENQKRLRWFGNSVTKPEHLAELKAIVSELLLYDVNWDALRSISLPEEDPLALKLQDLALIEEEFHKKLEGMYMTVEEIPEKLGELVGKSRLVSGSVIVLDGFTGFTPLQEKLIEKIMPLCSDLIVTVTIDAELNPFQDRGENDLFHLSSQTARTILQIAEDCGVPHSAPVFLNQDAESRHARVPMLAELEARIFRGGRRTGKRHFPDIQTGGALHKTDTKGQTDRERSGGTDEAKESISIFKAATPRDEVRHAALKIARLVRTQGYRYRDFAVISGDLAAYGKYIRQIFPEFGIPCFVDEKRSLLENPFLEFLRAALEAVSENWSYDSIFRMLKSGITDLEDDGVDRLENYARGTGVRTRKKWHEPFTRHYLYEDEAELPRLEELRVKVCALLDPLSEIFSKRGSTVREKTTALYELCVRSGAEGKLRGRADLWKNGGRPDLAREYSQVYPYVMDVFDKLVAALGDESISMRDYRALMEAGFSEVRVGIIPSENDLVVAGDMERTRLGGVKVLLFVGMNEGLVPKPSNGGGVLTEADRKTIAKGKLRLKPGAREQSYIDRFYMYTTLTRPSERLLLSYSVSDANGTAMRPSYLISEICRLFPEIPIQQEEADLAAKAEREETGLSLLAEGLGKIEKEALAGDYLELFSWYRNHPRWRARTEALLSAAGTRRTDDRISQAAARALYGDVLRNSASRLELFFSCSFAHFLTYGLRLRERPEYGFTGMDMGSIVHGALENLAGRTASGEPSWADLAFRDAQRREIVRASLESALRAADADVLRDTARDRYQVLRMERLLQTAAWAQAKLLAAGEFQPAGAEAAFRNYEEVGGDGRPDASGNSVENESVGMSSSLLMTSEQSERTDMSAGSSVDLEKIGGNETSLPDGTKMYLTGRIDRVDTCEAGDVTYVRIIDYKTGHVTFDLAEAYYGLELQLIVYLDAAIRALRKRGKYSVPAGAFYFQVQDPVVDYKDGEDAENVRERILQEMKGSGYVLDDTSVLAMQDRALAQSGKSNVLPVSYKKDGSFRSGSKVMTEEEFRLLLRHVMKKVREAAARIMRGEASVDPYELGNRTACDFCPLRSACGFDRRLPGCRYRELAGMKAEEVFARLAEEDR